MNIDNYGFNYDQQILPILKWVRYIYGVLMMCIVHPIFFYLLFRKSSGFHSGIRIGYIINQINMLIHDVYNDLLYQMYIPAPYPAAFCSGLLCNAFPNRGFELLILQCVIVAHGVPPYFYMILNTTQLILPQSSVLKISKRTFWILLSAVYIDLLANALYFCFGRSIQRPELFDQVSDLAWLKSYNGAISIIGGVDEFDGMAHYIYFFTFSATLLGLLMGWITFHAFYTLITYKNVSKSRSHLLQIRFMRILLIQTSLVVIFYGIPLAVLVGLVRFHYFPDCILSIGRCLSLFMYSINSIVECIILLIMTPKYQTIIKVKFLGLFGVVQKVKNENRIENTVTTKF